MSSRKRRQAEEQGLSEAKARKIRLAQERAEKADCGDVVRKPRMRVTMQVMGISIIASAVIILATKMLFDELFVQDDWSDVDWGDEEEDFDIDIEMN